MGNKCIKPKKNINENNDNVINNKDDKKVQETKKNKIDLLEEISNRSGTSSDIGNTVSSNNSDSKQDKDKSKDRTAAEVLRNKPKRSQSELSVSFDESSIKKSQQEISKGNLDPRSPRNISPRKQPSGSNGKVVNGVKSSHISNGINPPIGSRKNINGSNENNGNGVELDRISIGSITSVGFLGKDRGSVTPFGNVTFNFEYLRNVLKSELKDFSFTGMLRTGKVVDIYDGDTCRIAFYMKERFQNSSEIIMVAARLYGIDCPEIRTKNINEKNDAIKAKNYLCRHVTSVDTPDKIDENKKLVKVRFGKNDKFGRPLCIIFLPLNQEIEYYNIFENSFNHKMITSGHAKMYLGGTKEQYVKGNGNSNGTIIRSNNVIL